MAEATPVCDPGNEYDGRLGIRISAIFVIGVGSFLGTWFPVFAARHKSAGVPAWAFFIARYFGSGVIIATAFIHLLAPANEALGNECLTGVITEYPWVEGICLVAIFVLFFVELLTMRFAKFDNPDDQDLEQVASPLNDVKHTSGGKDWMDEIDVEGPSVSTGARDSDRHLSSRSDHQQKAKVFDPDSYAAQMTAIFILEFGVIFHSIFIGLTLAVAGAEFITLYIVLVFHQTFEGLALGSRLAAIPWAESKKWTPYFLGFGYALSTPIAIAAGLGVRTTFVPGSPTTLIVNGVFDSISAGILVYTGLIELMAHDFLFSKHMQTAPFREVLSAFGVMCLGAGLMALLGKWA